MVGLSCMAEFFAWQEGRPERFELVDGFPIRMMAGARNVHDDIVVNMLAEASQPAPRHRLSAVHRRRKHRDEARADPPSRRRRLRPQGSERNEGNLAPDRGGFAKDR